MKRNLNDFKTLKITFDFNITIRSLRMIEWNADCDIKTGYDIVSSINKQDGNVCQHQPRFILFSLPLNYKITKITKIYKFIKQNQILNINNIV